MPVSGKTAFLSINGVPLPLTSITITSENELQDVSNADTGAFVATVSDISDFTITAEGFWSGHIGLVEGATYQFAIGASAAGPFVTGQAAITSLEVTISVKDAAKFRLTAQSEGEFMAQL